LPLRLQCLPRSSLFPYTTLFRSTLNQMGWVGVWTGIGPRDGHVCGALGRSRSAIRSIFPPRLRGRRRDVRTRNGGAEPASFSRTDRKSTRLNSSHVSISYAVFCL